MGRSDNNHTRQHAPGRYLGTIASKGRTLLLLCTFCTLTNASLQFDKLQLTMSERYGEDGVLILRAWRSALEEAHHSETRQQLNTVNDFFNQRLQFTDDILLWQQPDYWATPLETMGVRAGDCEDYVIAKYISLLQLGIANEKLRLIYVRAQRGAAQNHQVQAHMVLGYYATPDAIPLILDNLVPDIMPADQRSDLSPVFSFNSEGLWIGSDLSASDPTSRLSRWRNVMQRMQTEGLTP
ncbi:MAG TPA: transglutaminase-like cysteine peptidase [Cellvibrionaceae bacterium]